MTNTEGCLDCGRGLCQFCKECPCCTESRKEIGGSTQSSESSVGTRHSETSQGGVRRASSNGNDIGRPIKEIGEIRDPKSTGRKRAAVYYPLHFDEPCEWRGFANCGGGKFPIIGCVEGKQQHRHHGPDKDTLNNSPGNVHRICDNCHNIWHSQNDKDYDPSIEHSPRLATQDELVDRVMKIRYVAA